MKIKEKIMKWWFFRVKNTTVRKGEEGGFKWRFRRFTMEISTVSGNFKARWTADAHPYGYLLSGKDDDNIHGYCQIVYEISKLLTTDQKFATDIQKAVRDYDKRLQKKAKFVEDETEEKIDLEGEKQVQEYVERKRK